jgi:hypothetical protein
MWRNDRGDVARPGFAEFMRQMLARLFEQLSIRILAPERHAAVARFDEIVIQDGSSLALRRSSCAYLIPRFDVVHQMLRL